jgi:hypothetical protein
MKKIIFIVGICLYISYSTNVFANNYGIQFERSDYIFGNESECVNSLQKPLKVFNKDGWKCKKSLKYGNICFKPKNDYTTKYQFNCYGRTMVVKGYVSKND